MAKQDKLTEILNGIKALKADEFDKLMLADINELNANDECLEHSKETLRDAADCVQESYCLLKGYSENPNEEFLRALKGEILNLDPEVIRLNRLYSKVTGHDSPYYFKYSHFSNSACRKIREIEKEEGLDG